MVKGIIWIHLPRRLHEFKSGVIDSIDTTFAKAVRGCQLRCSYTQCKNHYCYRRSELFNHLEGGVCE